MQTKHGMMVTVSPQRKRRMINLRAAALCLAIVATSAWAQHNASDATEKVLVVGQRPGPGLWKVSKGDHVMWVFGTYSPLPARMSWRSQQVEAMISQSQELLGAPGMNLAVGWKDSLNILTALPSLINVKKNVNGESLQQVVPPEAYARWSVLKSRYLGDNTSVESMRPLFAAEALFDKATTIAGLGSDTAVQKKIYEIAKQHKLKLTPTGLTIPLENPRGALNEFRKASLDDLDCFTKTIDRLETDLDGMRLRANAWAVGDVARMRALSYPNQTDACREAMTNSTWMKSVKGADDLDARSKASWLAAAEKALASNRSTFALLPVGRAMNGGGYLDALKEKGYTVEQPE